MRLSTLANRLSTQFGTGMDDNEKANLLDKTNIWYQKYTGAYEVKEKQISDALRYNLENFKEIEAGKVGAKEIPVLTKNEKIGQFLENPWLRHATALAYVPITALMQWILAGGLFKRVDDKDDDEANNMVTMFKMMQQMTKNSGR